MIDDESGQVTKKFFKSLKNWHQNNLKSMKGGEFAFDYVQLFVQLLYYNLITADHI